MKNYEKIIVTVIITAFGLLTLFLSSSVLFDMFGVRAQEGNYVDFVVWTNFLASMLYLAAVYGYITNKIWMTKPMFVSLSILVSAQIFFLIHIANGGVYEEKTVGAMIFRIAVTGIFTYLISRGSRNLQIVKP